MNRFKFRLLAFFTLLAAICVAIRHGAFAGIVCALAMAVTLTMGTTPVFAAVGTFNLLDLAARSGKGVTSVVEGVITNAPELRVVPMFPKSGITYSTLTRTELPTGDFREVGDGVATTKSVWKKETGSMALFEAQMRAFEDIIVAARSENSELTVGDLLADEAIATVKGSANKICSQFYYGSKISADGFAGLSTQVDAANNLTAGGGTGVDSSSAYLVYLDNNQVNPQGVHFLLGNGGRMQMSDTWNKQQVEVSAGKFAMAFINNFLAYLGSVMPQARAVYRINNIIEANPLTDALAAKLLSKVPAAMKADKSKWRWLMNSNAKYLLQASRTPTLSTDKGIDGRGAIPAEPTHLQGIEIVETDSLITTERTGLKP